MNQLLPSIEGKTFEDTFFADTATSRDEQCAVVHHYLKEASDSYYSSVSPDIFLFGAAHAQQAWIANRMASFIRAEDNSIRGFTTRFTASF